MKLMFFYSSMMAGGAERMISALANRYVQLNIDVSIVVIDDRPSFYELDPKIKYINLYRLQKSRNKAQALRNGLKLIRLTRKAFSEVNPDCVLCFGTNYLSYALLARGSSKIKIIGSERNNPQKTQKGFWGRIRKFISLFSDGFIFQTDGAKDCYPQIVRQKSAVIPNGLFVDNMRPPIPYCARRPNSICAVGRLHHQKGYDILLKAFAQFIKTRSSYTLTIVGEGNERTRLEGLIDELGLKGRVDLVGRKPDVIDIISDMQIYVLASRYEGMPNSLLEGMASGCACISTDCDFGPRELIIDGKNGLLVPVEDTTALAIALDTLAKDHVLSVKISQNAAAIRYSHSIQNIANQYLEYVVKVVGFNNPA